MSLFTGCILVKPSPVDGFRVSVMSRHTLNDGITPDPQIVPDSYHYHLPMLGPSPKLIGDYYRRGMSWIDFAGEYVTEISRGPKLEYVVWLADLALTGDVTILCIEPTPVFCHRRLLAEFCLTIEPNIHVEHR